MTVVGADVSATMERKPIGRVEMEQIQILLSPEDTVTSEARAEHIVEWRVEADSGDLAEGALDGCGGCGCSD